MQKKRKNPPRPARDTSPRSPAKRKPGGKKMTAYATFDLWYGAQAPRLKKAITALRAFVARTVPLLAESVKWGNGCWLLDGKPVAYCYADSDHLQFGFFRGAQLADPKRVLQGKGQYVRHVKVRTAADIDEAALTQLLHAASRVSP